MKCGQKLCQRTKNLGETGNCNVCDDDIVTITNNHKKIEKKNSLKPVQLDLKRMVETREKLSRGETVDQQTVSVLVLAGIINITSQHDTIAELESRIKALEHNDITHRSRIESLENWVFVSLKFRM